MAVVDGGIMNGGMDDNRISRVHTPHTGGTNKQTNKKERTNNRNQQNTTE
eukprot:gnl/Chilomastix_caulleri/2658.p6 GENE.gnl/Chilomastix_caulleri/2658~~gnl/Chilomastix_caulleri/2658.p6  ORF type:complete len:50 (+),score=22.42 gnl/Chilomastix_caulleri/2658:402-551(+)